jgi:hypothetical protein
VRKTTRNSFAVFRYATFGARPAVPGGHSQGTPLPNDCWAHARSRRPWLSPCLRLTFGLCSFSPPTSRRHGKDLRAPLGVCAGNRRKVFSGLPGLTYHVKAANFTVYYAGMTIRMRKVRGIIRSGQSFRTARLYHQPNLPGGKEHDLTQDSRPDSEQIIGTEPYRDPNNGEDDA